jgi:hypothetical protein
MQEKTDRNLPKLKKNYGRYYVIAGFMEKNFEDSTPLPITYLTFIAMNVNLPSNSTEIHILRR